jgi:hypothetical protein
MNLDPVSPINVMAGLDPAIHAMTLRLNCPSTSPAAFCTARALTTMGRFRGQRFCTVMAWIVGLNPTMTSR